MTIWAVASLHGAPSTATLEAQYQRLVQAAQTAAVLSEDHGYWIDFTSTYEVRMVALAAGRRLVAAGLLDAAEDVIHLTWDEVGIFAYQDTTGTMINCFAVAFGKDKPAFWPKKAFAGELTIDGVGVTGPDGCEVSMAQCRSPERACYREY